MKKITVYDCKTFSVDGKLVVNHPATVKNIVEYTLGDDTAYFR